MTLNLISQTEYEYFKYLDLEGNLSVHLLDLFYSILKFDLIGSTIRVYLALLIESLISIVIYIKSFPEELLHTPWEMFSFYDTYLEEKQKICKYLNLAIEISYIFSKFRIFEEMGDINKALFKDYQTLSQYLYNNQITNEYSLRVYYDGI
jgi:hypothetical protein